MLEKITPAEALPKKIYKERFGPLRRRLFRLQRAYWESELASVVVVEGWDGSGKGEVVNKITERLEPRAFKLHFVRPPRSHEALMPPMWRFWMRLPSYREMGLFVPSWYAHFVEQRVEQRIDPGLDDAEWARTWRQVNDFERALADDRYVVIKLFLHLGEEARRHRLEKLSKAPETGWKVDDRVWKAHDRYSDYRAVLEDVLVRTESEWAPWTIIEASDPRAARLRAAEVLADRLTTGLERHGKTDVLDQLVEVSASTHDGGGA